MQVSARKEVMHDILMKSCYIKLIREFVVVMGFSFQPESYLLIDASLDVHSTSDDVLMRDVLDVLPLVATEESLSIYHDITFKAVWSLCPRHNKLSNNTHILDGYS